MASSEAWGRFRHFRYDGGFWRRLAWRGSAYGPKWWVDWSPPAWAWLFHRAIGTNRRGARANLKRILPDASPRACRRGSLRLFVQFAHCLGEALEQLGPRPRPVRFDVPKRAEFDALFEEGKGLVVVTAHLGNWNIAATTLSSMGHPLHLVMARETNATVHPMLEHLRRRADARVIWADGSGAGPAVEMVRAVRSGGIVAIQLDRTEDPRTGIRAPFFGARALFPTGPFVLAAATQTPILPIFVPRLGRRHYEIRIGRPVRVPRGERGKALDPFVREVVSQFEDVVREFPDQWFRFSPFWEEDASPSAS